MADFLVERASPGVLHRVGRTPDPWAWPDWQYAGSDGTFGNRWDDPDGLYRVLYTSSTRLGCYLECLARFRPDPHVAAGLAAIDDDTALPPTAPAGVIPASWARDRRVGTGTCTRGVFANVASARSLALLNRALATQLIAVGLDELDAAAIRQRAPRALTQRISRFAFEASASGGALFAGLFYRSRLGDDLDNFALFEGDNRWELDDLANQPIDPRDPDLQEALRLLAVTLTE